MLMGKETLAKLCQRQVKSIRELTGKMLVYSILPLKLKGLERFPCILHKHLGHINAADVTQRIQDKGKVNGFSSGDLQLDSLN